MAIETIRFDLGGVSEMENALKLLPARVAERELIRAARAGSQVVRKAVKAAAPRSGQTPEQRSRRTSSGKNYGALANNIRVTTRTKGKRHSVEVAIHTGNAFWGMFLEFGTSRMAPRPFFAPAWDKSRDAALAAVAETLASGIDRTAKELALRNPTGRLTRSTRRLL